MRAAQPSQAHMWPQGRNSTDAFLSEHTTHSSICRPPDPEARKKTKKKRKKNNDNKIELKERNHGEIIEDVYTLVRVVMGSLQTRHFLTRGAQAEQQLT
jgi:hypothetical protein